MTKLFDNYEIKEKLGAG